MQITITIGCKSAKEVKEVNELLDQSPENLIKLMNECPDIDLQVIDIEQVMKVIYRNRKAQSLN